MKFDNLDQAMEYIAENKVTNWSLIPTVQPKRLVKGNSIFWESKHNPFKLIQHG